MSNKLINPNCVSIYTHVYVYLDNGYMPIYSTRTNNLINPNCVPMYAHKLPVYLTNLHPYIRHNSDIIFFYASLSEKIIEQAADNTSKVA